MILLPLTIDKGVSIPWRYSLFVGDIFGQTTASNDGQIPRNYIGKMKNVLS